MRKVTCLKGHFDAAIIIWSSFGFFSHEENIDLINSLSSKLRKGGRLIIDLQNAEYYETGKFAKNRILNWNGRIIEETTTYGNNLLKVTLDYNNGKIDTYEWKLYSLKSLSEIAETCALKQILVVQNFDLNQNITENTRRYQIVYTKL